jgi:hypothetical protein
VIGFLINVKFALLPENARKIDGLDQRLLLREHTLSGRFSQLFDSHAIRNPR